MLKQLAQWTPFQQGERPKSAFALFSNGTGTGTGDLPRDGKEDKDERSVPLMIVMNRDKIMKLIKRSRPIRDVTSLSLQRQPAGPPVIGGTDTASINSLPLMKRDFSEPHLPSDPELMNILCSNLVKFGLHDALFSDITVKALGTSYNLHRIVLFNNPYLAGKMEELQEMREDAGIVLSHWVLELDIMDLNVNDEGIQIVFKRLYGDFSDHVTYDNLLALLATSFYFQDYELSIMCRDFIKKIEYSSSNALIYLDYASRFDYGYPTSLLLKNVLTYLCREGSTSKNLRSKTFPKMEFDWFVRIVQSDVFFVDSEYERFNFIVEVLKIRFPNFAEYTMTIDGLNTNVLSLGKLVHLPSKTQAKAKRMSQISMGESFRSDKRPSAEDFSRYSTHRLSGAYDIPESPRQARRNTLIDAGGPLIDTHAVKSHRRSMVLLALEDGEDIPQKLNRHSYHGELPPIAPIVSSNATEPSPKSKRHSGFMADDITKKQLIVENTYSDAMALAAQSAAIAADATPKVRRRSALDETQRVVVAAGSAPEPSKRRSSNVNEDAKVRRRSAFIVEDDVEYVRPTSLAIPLVTPKRSRASVSGTSTQLPSSLEDKSNRRKSMFDPPSHHEFGSPNYSLFYPEASGGLSLSSLRQMTRTSSMPVIKTRRSRASTMPTSLPPPQLIPEPDQVSTISAPAVAFNNSAHIEPSVALLSKGVLYCNMPRESALLVREERAIPTFVFDRHFRLQCDLQDKITALAPQVAAAAKDPAIKPPSPILGIVNPIEGKTGQYNERCFMNWLMEEELCMYDSLDVPPLRFSAEFANLTKFLKGQEKLTSEAVPYAGSSWFLRVENTKDSNMAISICRKLTPYSPYNDTRPDIKFWCRVVCYTAITSAVTDTYTFEIVDGTIALNGAVSISGNGTGTSSVNGRGLTRDLFKELSDFNAKATENGGANLRFSVVLGVL
ncbi:hypothetical protein HDU99_000007 [Rhizoclosmatium hyalinum]|nr:hypothetical protein HDU99_000007 [Rhizoclosmatium hyalinum]